MALLETLAAWVVPSFILKASSNGKLQGIDKPPDKYVLVPPLFERGNRDRDRFLHSSYEYAFAKRPLKRLMEDYIQDQYQGVLLLAPEAQAGSRNMSIEARIAPGDAAMSLRYQPQESEPSTFLNVTVQPQVPAKSSFGCSLFNPELGLGVFATAPLAKQLSGTFAKVGARYSSPVFTTGFTAEPAKGALSSLWAVGRYAGLVGGMQLRLDDWPSSSGVSKQQESPSSAGAMDMDYLRKRLCYAVAYEPTFAVRGGTGQFTASIEMLEGRNMLVSFYQHIAQVRKQVNPMEDKNVVGITNYIDLGIQINLDLVQSPTTGVTSSSSSSTPASKGLMAPGGVQSSSTAMDYNGGTINAAAAWQINKNWLFKCRVGDQSAAAGVAVKSWGQMGAVAAASVTCRYDNPTQLRYGATLQLENFGERRYERGASALSGRAVLQRHEATDVDVMNSEGTGKVVIREALESDYNVHIPNRTADYL